MKHYTRLTNTRVATNADFRTPRANLKLNLQYYEKMLYTNIWVLRVTDEDTDRDWLKAKIALGQIHVPLTPVLWNQDPNKIKRAQEKIKTLTHP